MWWRWGLRCPRLRRRWLGRGGAPLGSPLGARDTPRLLPGLVRTIPLAPFLSGRGNNNEDGLWRHILHTSCHWGGAPLDSPLGARNTLHTSCRWGGAPLGSPFGARGTPTTVGVPLVGTHRPSVRTIPLAPFLRGRGNNKEDGLWRYILHTSCHWGSAPLDPLRRAGHTHHRRGAPRGYPPAVRAHDVPPNPASPSGRSLKMGHNS